LVNAVIPLAETFGTAAPVPAVAPTPADLPPKLLDPAMMPRAA
jgi:hypothetical protein